MKNHIGRVILLVNDYEEALDFYAQNFGFEKLFDATTDQGQRFLHVGSKKPETGIWFMKAISQEDQNKVGRQTAGQPVMVIYTDAIEELYHQLVQNQVKIKKKPVISPEYSFFHCYDLYGNEIVVVELQ